MRCGVIAVVVTAASLTAVATPGEPPAVARYELRGRQSASRGQYPYLALVANMWGECSAAILAPSALLGPSSCLPQGYLHNGRVEAGNNRFFTMQDFGNEPTQARIIDKFIKMRDDTQDANSLMVMKLLQPFQFTSYVQPVPIATERRNGPVQALVVGYGMGGEQWPLRQQASLEVVLEDCRPPQREALCVAAAGADCVADHGAAVVAGGRLLAVAGTDPLCDGQVMLVAPHSEWIREQLRSFGEDLCGECGRALTSAAGSRSRGRGLLVVRSAAALLALALAVCALS